MTDLETLKAELDAAYLAAYAFDAEAARVAYSAARDALDAARVAYSAARDASKAYLATLAAQEQETDR
jgi:hypothetical protein